MSITEIDLAIVCPMANEGKAAPLFVSAVLDRCVGFRKVSFFAILDRATTDGSLELLKQLEQTESRLRVIWAPENRCVVDAYLRGYHEALGSGADWILEIDAGFSHQPDDIPRFFQAMEEGYDCIFGSRFIQGGHISETPLKRQVLSRGGTLLANVLLGTKLKDMTSGFELFSRNALQMVLDKGIQSRAHFFQTEIKTYCAHLRTKEVPIHYKSASPRVSRSAVLDSVRQLGRLARLRYKGKLWPETASNAEV
jgi:dolichol-phosphate mannosyltransferase